MNSSITFFRSVNKNLVSELDILNFIDEKTKNDFSKLEQLNKDLEDFEVTFMCETIWDNNPIPVSELFKKFKIIVSTKLETKNINEINKQKVLFDYINNIEDKEAFLLDLKNAFPTEKGKSIKSFIDLLKNEDILIIGTKEFKHFVELLTDYFGRNIGTYNGIQNTKTIDKAISDPINTKLKPLIIKHKTT
jgi:hypothetical protein